jgi:hypothetical protein
MLCGCGGGNAGLSTALVVAGGGGVVNVGKPVQRPVLGWEDDIKIDLD